MIDRMLGKYHIVARLGSGGMADVYKAYQANLDRYVALKFIKTDATQDTEYLTRFEREAKSAASLRHPNIVQVYDFDIDLDSGAPYLVMELIEGGALSNYIAHYVEQGLRVPLAEVARMTREVGAALAYAHQRGIIHRDVKPANILRDSDGRLILSDFGLVKVNAGPSMSVSAVAVGTPAYMAPEQVLGQAVDGRTDLYALGVIAFELLTNQLPFRGDSSFAVALKHVNELPPDPRDFTPTLPDSVARVVLQALAKQPNDRFQTVADLVAALQAALTEADHSIAPQPIPPIPLGLPPVVSKRTAARSGWPGATSLVPWEATPPPEPSLPPKVVNFVGRESELAYFEAALAQQHLVIISGMPGVGKTALASVLAWRVSEPVKIFWHSFHAGEGVNVLIWKLAGFLAWRGQDDPWRMLQSAQQTVSQAPPPEVLFDYLFQMIRGQGYLLCFDDFQFVEDDALLSQFVVRLKAAVEAGEVSTIITSRHLLGFASPGEYETLTGLSQQDMRRLLDRRGLDLSGELATLLYTHTEGNAQFLTLAVDTLVRGKDSSRLISRLSESSDIERFLMKRVDEGLDDDEREVMGAVAVLLGYPGTRDAISAILDGRSVRRTLNGLCSRYLVAVTEGEIGKEYSLHAMVQAFYYDLLNKHERQVMHRRASEFYGTEEPDALKAVRHLHQAGEDEHAAQLATAHVGTLINQGQAQALRQLLKQLDAPSLSHITRAGLHETRGDLEHLLGEFEKAILEYQTSIEVSAAADVLSRARLHRKLGNILFRHGKYDEALSNLSRGRDLLAAASETTVENARIAVVYAQLLLALARYDEAAAEAQMALASLSEPSLSARTAADLHDVQAQVHFYKGHFAQSLEEFQSALELRRAASDQQGTIKSYNNLAVVYGQQNRYADALSANEAALKIAERIGDVIALAQIYTNMAVDAMEQGRYDQAIEFNQHSLALFEKMGNLQGLSMARYNVGEIYQRMGNLDLAAEHLTQAVEFAERIRDQSGAVIGMQTLAEVRLAQGKADEALNHCQASLQLAEEIDDQVWRPSGLRLLGRIRHRLNEWEGARSAFAEACQIWRERETSLDLANTLLQWACLEYDAKEVSRARIGSGSGQAGGSARGR